MVDNTNNDKSKSEDNAIGSSLGIIKISGDKIFNKIYKMQLPQSSNAVGTSFESLSYSSKEIFQKISKAPNILNLPFKFLASSGKQLIERIPKTSPSNHAMGASLKTMKVSSKNLLDKIFRK